MDWIFLIAAVFAVIIIKVTHTIFTAYGKRRTLHWIPEVPGVPVLGNVLELGDSTKSLNAFNSYLERFSGLCRVNFIYDTSILTYDSKLLEFILSSNKILVKATEYKFLWNWLGTGLLTSDGRKWKKNRKIITPAFHFSILEQFVDVFESKGQIMVGLLDKEVGKILNIYQYVTMCSLDIICETAMGVSINAQKNVHSEYAFCVKEMCRITIDRTFSLKRYDLFYPLSRDYYKEKKYMKVLHGMTNSVIRKRKEELQKSKPEEKPVDEEGPRKKLAFLDILLKSQMEGQDISDTDIREEVDTFMFEGHDTTTSAICFTLFCLANHPEYQSQAFEEQKTLLGDDKNRNVTYRDLQEMKFLELVIKESLRLYPSVPFFARYADTDITYRDGQVIPEGTNIIMFAFGANRNPKVFENPNEFNPYRFETTESKQWYYSYIPFSVGPRNCIGQKFAMLEVKSVVSKVLRNFVLHSAGPEHDVILTAETVLTSRNGFHLKLTKREW